MNKKTIKDIDVSGKKVLVRCDFNVPILCPCALQNVYAIPPPITNVSTLSNKFSITPILSDTFAPPSIATNGCAGFSNAPPKNSNSFSIKNPDTAGKYEATPVVELCALCAVPNASLT